MAADYLLINSFHRNQSNRQCQTKSWVLLFSYRTYRNWLTSVQFCNTLPKLIIFIHAKKQAKGLIIFIKCPRPVIAKLTKSVSVTPACSSKKTLLPFGPVTVTPRPVNSTSHFKNKSLRLPRISSKYH